MAAHAPLCEQLFWGAVPHGGGMPTGVCSNYVPQIANLASSSNISKLRIAAHVTNFPGASSNKGEKEAGEAISKSSAAIGLLRAVSSTLSKMDPNGVQSSGEER